MGVASKAVLADRRTIKVKLAELLTLQPVLTTVCQSQSVDVKVAYRLARLQAKIIPDIQAFEKERMKAVTKLGTRVPTDEEAPNGQVNWQLDTPEIMEEYKTIIETLSEEEVVLDNIIPLALSDLAPANLTAAQLLQFLPFLDEEIQEKENQSVDPAEDQPSIAAQITFITYRRLAVYQGHSAPRLKQGQGN